MEWLIELLPLVLSVAVALAVGFWWGQGRGYRDGRKQRAEMDFNAHLTLHYSVVPGTIEVKDKDVDSLLYPAGWDDKQLGHALGAALRHREKP